MYNIIYETIIQSRINTGYRMLGVGAELTQRMVQGGGGRGVRRGWEHMYTYVYSYLLFKANTITSKKIKISKNLFIGVVFQILCVPVSCIKNCKK